MNARRASSFTDSPSTLQPKLIADWPRLPSTFILDRVAGVAVDSHGRIVLAHRGQNPLLRLNPDGTLHSELGKESLHTSIAYDLRGPTPIPMPPRYWLHGLHIDAWDNIWITDVSRHLVIKFSPEGKVIMTLGIDGKSGSDDLHFNQPTHVCVVPSGEIFVTDGYGNSRVVKFTAQGEYLMEWGQRGTEPGDFHSPHVIVCDRNGLLYVSDRENDRIQRFDQAGKLHSVWPGLHSVDGLSFAPDGSLYGSAGVDNAIIRFDEEGKPAEVWAPAGRFHYPHALAFSSEGRLFTAETGDKWKVTGQAPHERQMVERAGPEGSQIQQHKFV